MKNLFEQFKLLNPDEKKQIDNLIIKLKQQEITHGPDPFGLDLRTLERVFIIIYFFYKFYFRVEVKGAGNLPAGPAIFVANHGGQLPFDALMVTTAVALSAEHPRLLRSMVEKWVPSLPFVSEFFQSLGQPTGTPENFRLLAARGESLLVFPEGVEGISKPFSERYKLRNFPTSFLKLGQEFSLPIVPVAIIGSEEQYPSIGSLATLAKFLRAPAFPITPFFPLFGIFGALPLPTKYRIYFGPPIDTQCPSEQVSDKVKKVREQLQSMLYRGLAKRENIFW